MLRAGAASRWLDLEEPAGSDVEMVLTQGTAGRLGGGSSGGCGQSERAGGPCRRAPTSLPGTYLLGNSMVSTITTNRNPPPEETRGPWSSPSVQEKCRLSAGLEQGVAEQRDAAVGLWSEGCGPEGQAGRELPGMCWCCQGRASVWKPVG